MMTRPPINETTTIHRCQQPATRTPTDTRLLRYKIRENSTTNRVIATCCNSAMFLNFDDGKHWVDLYRSRCQGDVLPVQMRICTKFKPDGRSIPTDVPHYSRYPMSLLMKLLLAKA